MPSFLRKLHPQPPPKEDYDDEQFNVEYSFAVEYSGPPPDYTIPKAVPLYVDRIPTASIASKVGTLSVPVIQPVTTKAKKLNQKSGSLSPNSVIQSSGFGIGVSEALASSDSCGNSSRLVYDRENLDAVDGPEQAELIPKLESSIDIENEGEEDLIKSYLGSAACGSEVSFCTENEEGDHISVVENSAFSEDEEEEDEDERIETNVKERPICRTDLKKGICHKCFKGNRFMEKEVCFVCGAKYCGNCVLRTMGTMQEGRKCITCIGFSIDESKRGALGKPSRLLKRLLIVSEVERIMQSEISSPVNHLQSQLVYVNGKPLSHSEFTLLQNCTCPPKKLKPGRYWYDRVAGFWGKEEHKPCQIISCELAVGDQIKENASNGNTNVLVNRRRITKKELWMLQRAGVHCEGEPHFWLGSDGSCSLEGQKNVLCKIWDKPGIKIFCSLLFLPTPPQLANDNEGEGGEGGGQVDILPSPNDFQQKTVNKILLVGYDKSGTSTIFKQAKIVYNIPFSEDERESLKFIIQSKLYWYLGILLEGRQRFEEEYLAEMRNKFINQPGPSDISRRIEEGNVYSIGKRVKRFSDWLLEIMMCGNLEIIFPEASLEYGPLVQEVWRDKGFQATFNRINEIDSLPTVANYFLTRAVEISNTDYEPSDMDILYAEGITSSNRLSNMEFSLPQSTFHQSCFMDAAEPDDRLLRYQLIRVHSSSLGGGNCKLLDMFEDVEMVMYTVDITQYDEIGEDGINKMVASRNLFESIVTHPNFKSKNFLLLLNKMDLLEEKIEHVPLRRCEWFEDFNPVRSRNPGTRETRRSSSSNNNNNNNNRTNNNYCLSQLGFHHVAVKFKRLFSSLTGGRKLYVSQVTGLEQESVDEAFRYAREILKWDNDRRPKTTTSLNEEEESSTMSSS
ncbi:extra-large guanine nucleotide-binding protein 1-like [Impatiens glandulifera]|uniref:extra-large guanine nucleotide-binding protein 1-like n=1 Tax=Impatiens glandulifera TaxID=253017 RepID=UPI001FB0BA09|nr:extra-large guanine nucleotide-binding protein 1-like [Impatiens glandulifera]